MQAMRWPLSLRQLLFDRDLVAIEGHLHSGANDIPQTQLRSLFGICTNLLCLRYRAAVPSTFAQSSASLWPQTFAILDGLDNSNLYYQTFQLLRTPPGKELSRHEKRVAQCQGGAHGVKGCMS